MQYVLSTLTTYAVLTKASVIRKYERRTLFDAGFTVLEIKEAGLNVSAKMRKVGHPAAAMTTVYLLCLGVVSSQ